MRTSIQCRCLGLVLVAGLFLGGCATDRASANSAEDARITAGVRAAFARSPFLLGGNTIDVSTTDGVVQLYGIVDTGLELNEVESIARAVPGVKSVSNDISINTGRD